MYVYVESTQAQPLPIHLPPIPTHTHTRPLVQEFPGKTFDRFYVSEYIRCMETAARLNIPYARSVGGVAVCSEWVVWGIAWPCGCVHTCLIPFAR